VLDDSDTFFKTGKTARELIHKVTALARCAGSGRGVSRRSGLCVRRMVTWPRIAGEVRGGLDPASQHLHFGGT